MKKRMNWLPVKGILLLLMLLQAGIVCAAQTGEKKGTENRGCEVAFPHEFEDITGAKILSHDRDTYAPGDEEWERQIAQPSEQQLFRKATEEKKKAFKAVYKLENDWGSGFTAVFRITNCSEQDMEGWRLSFDFDREIKSIWDAGIESREGNHYVIRNAGYNAVIRPGGTVSFGITGTGGRKEDIPVRWKLSAADGEAEEAADTLLIEDTLPWESDANSVVLEKLGIPFVRVNMAEAEKLDFSRYSLIITADDQESAFYTALSEQRTRLERYVMNGGVLLYGICDGGWAKGRSERKAPGDVELEAGNREYNRIVDTDHPIVTGIFTDGRELKNSDLYGSYASHETFIRDSLPADANIILEDDLSRPTLVEYPMGDGFVIASGLAWEHNYYYNYKFAWKAADDLFAYACSLTGNRSMEGKYRSAER